MSTIVQQQPMSLLTQLADRRAFVIFRLLPRPDGKTDKIPVHPLTGAGPPGEPDKTGISAQDPANWMSAAEAALWASQWGQGYGVGIVISEGCGIFALDLDNCREPNGGWQPHVAAFEAMFPQAARETSISGTGRHIFIGYSGTLPAHGTRNKTYRMEGYSKARFIAVTGTDAVGSALVDYTAQLRDFVARYFPPRSDHDAADWTDGPCDGYTPIADDAALIQRALQSAGASSVFGGRASFADLWRANTDALARTFPPQSAHQTWDGSAADQALANHLIFWTCGDCERTLRIMREHPELRLRRDKWARQDYLHSTIRRARADAKEFYKGIAQVVTAVPSPPATTASAVPLPPSTSTQQIDQYVSLIDRTDAGNANLLVKIVGGNLRYVVETRQWLRWTNTRWQLDEHEEFANGSALEVARHYIEEARRLEGMGRQDLADTLMKWATKCRNKTALEAMLVQARKVSGVAISVHKLDRNPLVLGVENGVIDLRTGQLREDARDDYVTKRCPLNYNPLAAAPRWEQAIAEITGLPIEAQRDAQGAVVPNTVGRYTPRPALARYLQKALGYSLTGSTQEHKFFICIGGGSNGKGVIFDTLLELLGPYAMAMPSEMFMATKHAHDAERPTALAASVAGVRLVVSSETKHGQQLDIGVVKNHTGDKKLTARRMRQDPITFEITHKPWLLTNPEPKIEHLDAAIRGRLHLLPFDRRWNRPGEPDPDAALPDGDKTLMAHLLTQEQEGILAWLVRGAMLYCQEGLTPPPEVTGRTRQYVMAQDHLGRWLRGMELCAVTEGTLAASLYQQFCAWCREEGVALNPSTATAFGRALDAKRVESKKFRDGMRYGLRISSSTIDEKVTAAFGTVAAPLPPGAVPPPPPVGVTG
jgi:P4 family phage/plasmid primase-like protien